MWALKCEHNCYISVNNGTSESIVCSHLMRPCWCCLFPGDAPQVWRSASTASGGGEEHLPLPLTGSGSCSKATVSGRLAPPLCTARDCCGMQLLVLLPIQIRIASFSHKQDQHQRRLKTDHSLFCTFFECDLLNASALLLTVANAGGTGRHVWEEGDARRERDRTGRRRRQLLRHRQVCHVWQTAVRCFLFVHAGAFLNGQIMSRSFLYERHEKIGTGRNGSANTLLYLNIYGGKSSNGR